MGARGKGRLCGVSCSLRYVCLFVRLAARIIKLRCVCRHCIRAVSSMDCMESSCSQRLQQRDCEVMASVNLNTVLIEMRNWPSRTFESCSDAPWHAVSMKNVHLNQPIEWFLNSETLQNHMKHAKMGTKAMIEMELVIQHEKQHEKDPWL